MVTFLLFFAFNSVRCFAFKKNIATLFLLKDKKCDYLFICKKAEKAVRFLICLKSAGYTLYFVF
ncbi:hypothetical protein C9J48_23440 [Photobacterium profundum]|nr:hypothetical protein C9J48_23440 [Photobacterium profundum]